MTIKPKLVPVLQGWLLALTPPMTTHCTLLPPSVSSRTENMISFWSYRRNDGLLDFPIPSILHGLFLGSFPVPPVPSSSGSSFTSTPVFHSWWYSHCRSCRHNLCIHLKLDLLQSSSPPHLSQLKQLGFLRWMHWQWPCFNWLGVEDMFLRSKKDRNVWCSLLTSELLLSHSTSFSLYLRLWKFPQNLIGSSHFLRISWQDTWGGILLCPITLIWQFLTTLASISLTNALFPDSIYKTTVHVCYSICLNLSFYYCSHCLLDLWSLKHHSVNSELWFPNFQKYSTFNLTSTLSSIKATLSSRLNSETSSHWL